MSEWKECTIGDLGKIITGKTPRTAISENYGGKVPFLSPSDNMELKYVDKTNKTLTEQGVDEVKNCLLPTNAVCVSCIGSDLGKVLITTQPTVTNQQINSLIVNEDNDTDFIYYLMTIVGKHLNFISKTSTAVPIINKTTFSNYKISVPLHSEQKRIAAILSSLDEKIETNRKINARLEELAQALFKSWFIDFEPFGGKMPEDWDYRYVSDFPHEIEPGKRPKGGVSGITEGIPSIGAESIKGIGYYDYSKTKYIPYEYAESLKKGRIQDFDLLIYKDGGKPGYFIPDFSMMGLGFPFKEMVLNEHVFRLNFGKPELNIFAYFYFKTDDVMNYLNSVGGKAAIPGINQKNVEDIKIIDLNVTKVTEFGTIVLPMFKTILENCKESARLAALRDTLLPKLMSGELIPE